MSIAYSSEEVARAITGQLKAVAREVDSADQLHLPDFLELDPRAAYPLWKKKLEEKHASIVNLAEGTANEREKLCQSLIKEFKTSNEWRGLLNRLGRMQVESAVAGLARRKPDDEGLRSAFSTHVHTLEYVVGAPDGSKVVEQLFRERGLRIPAAGLPKPAVAKPEAKPEIAKPEIAKPEIAKPKPAPAPAQPRAAAAAAVSVQPKPPDGGGFWGLLGGVLLQELGKHLDRKLDDVKSSVESERTIAAETLDIGGRWYSPTGGSFTFTQRGSSVTLNGYSPEGAPVQGQGQIRGKSIQLAGFSPAGGPFRVNLVVTPDGRGISGHVLDSFGRSSPVQLYR